MERNLIKLFEEVLNSEKAKPNVGLAYLNSLFMQDVFRNTSLKEARENSDFQLERDLINNLIASKRFNSNPEEFFESLERARGAISKSGTKYDSCLLKRDLGSLERENVKTYKLEGFDIGFALKKKDNDFSEIIAMFNATGHSGIGYLLIEAAISLGGEYLECFGEELMKKVHRQSGFKVKKENPNVKAPDGSGDENTLYQMELGDRKKEYLWVY